MVQSHTEQASAPSDQDGSENDAVVTRLVISSDGDHDLTFIRYADGGVMLKQADDRVALTKEQFDLLTRFLKGVEL